MKIILGSNNISKKKSVMLALSEFGIIDYEIICVGIESNVSSKPINDETLMGTLNRTHNLLQYCKENDISFDLLISIEGGYEQVIDNYFVVTYASIMDKDGETFIGKSQGLQISQKMFDWVKNGRSLNQVIESIEGCVQNKKGNGICGYLSSSYYKRAKFDSSAVISALVALLNKDKNYRELDIELNKNYTVKKKITNGSKCVK